MVTQTPENIPSPFLKKKIGIEDGQLIEIKSDYENYVFIQTSENILSPNSPKNSAYGIGRWQGNWN